jgi:hypothetical protein
MGYIFRLIEKILYVVPGGIFGLASVFFALSGILIAFFSFPGFSILLYDVSYLAIGPLGLFFDLGLIFSGILAIPFNFYMIIVIEDKKIKPRLKKYALSLSIMSSITLSLIGFFPVLIENIIILFIHGILALLTFLGVTIYCILFGYFFIINEKFSNFHAILSFFVSGIFIFYFTNRWSLIEWIGILSIMIWITYNSITTLIKK